MIKLNTSIDFYGYSDFWQGHGHAFDSTTLACIVFSIPVDYTETCQEIREQIMQELQQAEWSPVNITDEDLTELSEKVSDEMLENSVREVIIGENTEKFFGEDLQGILEKDCYELPVLIGYVHAYQKED